jgi:hypothetical protein
MFATLAWTGRLLTFKRSGRPFWDVGSSEGMQSFNRNDANSLVIRCAGESDCSDGCCMDLKDRH